jgi:YidC/Oxa1 family membrane protein insertase
LAEYQNPQHEPGSERRLLIIFLATFALMLVLQPLYKKYFPPPTPPQQQTQSNPAQSATTPAAAEVAAPSVPTPPVGVTMQASGESETVIENDLYRITFTNKGAQVKSWILKKYNNDAQSGPLDLVNPLTAPKFGYPLSLWTYDETLRNKLASALYVTSKEGSEASPNTVTFEYADQDVAVHKTFRFDESYVVSVETSVTQKGAPVAAFPAWPAGFGDQMSPAFYAASFVDYQYGSKVERVPPRCGFSLFSKCTQAIGGGTVPGPFHWAGPTDQYFGAIFIPDTPDAATMVTLNNSIKVTQDPQKKDAKDVDVNVLGAAVGNLHGPTVERIFVGPKEFDILKKIPVPGVADNDLNGLVDFGFFGVIAKVLFLWLRWTYYHMIPNWGWAIVVQTLIITAALLPLRVTQMKSMLKMQRVAPQIKSIQEKYKKYSLRDPRKAAMNEEISALYKKEGVNPAGGCLPMLIQLPFIWAYYRMLGNVIDLRHAHWLWIHDLSAADPIFILPIMLVVTSLITQRMTPQAGMDPSQQKMMNVMMPLMMGFIFFRLAAGLNLYYTVVNIVSVAQQAVMNRTKLGQEMREMMAKRARKKEK